MLREALDLLDRRHACFVKCCTSCVVLITLGGVWDVSVGGSFWVCFGMVREGFWSVLIDTCCFT